MMLHSPSTDTTPGTALGKGYSKAGGVRNDFCWGRAGDRKPQFLIFHPVFRSA